MSREKEVEKAPAGKELSPEVIERKTKFLVDEYLHLYDLKVGAITLKGYFVKPNCDIREQDNDAPS